MDRAGRGGSGWAAPYGDQVRWDALFSDLEAQLAAAGAPVDDPERVRAELARAELSDRLRGQTGAPLRLHLRDGHVVAGSLLEATPAWVLLEAPPRQVLVPLPALAWVAGLSPALAPPAGLVERRLGLGSALRALARDRAAVQLRLTAAVLDGTIDRVGADHLDLAEHAVGEARRAGSVRAVLTVPFASLLAVASRPVG